MRLVDCPQRHVREVPNVQMNEIKKKNFLCGILQKVKRFKFIEIERDFF